MALRRIECIDRALQHMFHAVLVDCGDADPPQLKDVRVERDNRNNGVELRARFGVEGQPDKYIAYLFSQRELMMDRDFGELARGAGRSFLYDAGILWSRMYEDHYIERMRRAGQSQVVEAMNIGDMRLAQYRSEMVEQLTRHAAIHHQDLMRDPGPSQTATEIRARQREFRGYNYTFTATDEAASVRNEWVSEAVRQHAQDMDAQIARAMGIDLATNTSTTANATNSTMNVETLRAAMAALERNPYHGDWRRAFVVDQRLGPVRTLDDYYGAMDDLARYGSSAWFVVPDVGSKQAQERGRQLLLDNLSPDQKTSYENDGYFDVKGSDTGKTYRIRHGRQMNIEELDASGKRACGWCFVPVGSLVAGDCMLAQKTALESFESEAIKIANRF